MVTNYSSTKYTFLYLESIISLQADLSKKEAFRGYRKSRVSRRFLRVFGRKRSTRPTNSDADMFSAEASSRIVVSEGLYLPRSRRLMYFGWYPLSKPSASWERDRSSLSSMRARAKARLSGASFAGVLPPNGIGSMNAEGLHDLKPQSILSIRFSRPIAARAIPPEGPMFVWPNLMTPNANRIVSRQEFQIQCDAGDTGQFRSEANRASITVGQRILRDGAEEMWDSVVVLCQEEEDGALAIRVVLCHPDWDEPREIAVIRSSQKDAPLGVRILSGRQVGEAEWSESRPRGRWKK